MSPLLEVKDLSVTFRGNPIVDGVSFDLDRGQALGLAGESGCGKTTSALAVMKLLPSALKQQAEAITLNVDGEPPINIDRRTERGMEQVRWRHVSLIFQGAMNALDPVQRIDKQIAEAIRLHDEDVSSDEVEQRISELFTTVGIAPSRARTYPHQFSGGQRQRVMIALALACRPSLVIADEPTTALDVMMQAQILELLEELRERLGLALILISHDLSVLAETCDRVAIMYAGRIVEEGPVHSVYDEPHHPYTKRLLGAFPVIGGERHIADAIPGAPPDPSNLPRGCNFMERCPYAEDRCGEVPELRQVAADHRAACHFAPWSKWPEPKPTIAESAAFAMRRAG